MSKYNDNYYAGRIPIKKLVFGGNVYEQIDYATKKKRAKELLSKNRYGTDGINPIRMTPYYYKLVNGKYIKKTDGYGIWFWNG